MFDQNTGQIPGTRWPEAREKMRELKARLRAEYGLRSMVRVGRAMTPIESAIYFPGIEGAKIQITVLWNSRPDRKWHDQLYAARIDIEHALSDLEH
jgi:hypothetical protein